MDRDRHDHARMTSSNLWMYGNVKVVAKYLMDLPVQERGVWLATMAQFSMKPCLQVVREIHKMFVDEGQRLRRHMSRRGKECLISPEAVQLTAEGVVRM